MSKIGPLMGVNARFGKEVKQNANALKKAVSNTAENQVTRSVLMKSKFDPKDIVSLNEVRAAFPEQPASKGSKLNVLA